MLALGVLGGCGTTGGLLDSGNSVENSCVLYARAASAIDIRGDAYTWWDASAGRYLRGSQPEPGAVLVLAKTDRLRLGHVAVVRQVLGDRDILVDHSNWVPGRIITSMEVRDVSPTNDWSELRFFNRSAGAFGATYPAYGFIYPPVPLQPRLADSASGQAGPQVAPQ
jgi:surface antigen